MSASPSDGPVAHRAQEEDRSGAIVSSLGPDVPFTTGTKRSYESTRIA